MLRYYFSETFNIYYMKKIYLFLFTIALSAGSVFSQKTNEIYFSPVTYDLEGLEAIKTILSKKSLWENGFI